MQLESVWLNRTNHDVALLNIGFAPVKEGSKPCPLCWLLKNVQIQGASFGKLRINSPEE